MGSLGLLLENAMAGDWREALFEYNKKLLGNNQMPVEDVRAADWQYLVDIHPDDSVCIVGGYTAIVPLAVAPNCERLTFVNDDLDLLGFVALRAEREGIRNILLVHAKDMASEIRTEQQFDLCCFYNWYGNERKGDPFAHAASWSARFLRQNGSACFFIENKIASMLMNGEMEKKNTTMKYALRPCRRFLQNRGFEQVSVYSPVPSWRQVPLFFLPIDSNQALRYFIRRLFPLFFNVTPESRSRAGAGFAVAATGARIMQLFRMEWLLRFFVPEYLVMARKRLC